MTDCSRSPVQGLFTARCRAAFKKDAEFLTEIASLPPEDVESAEAAVLALTIDPSQFGCEGRGLMARFMVGSDAKDRVLGQFWNPIGGEAGLVVRFEDIEWVLDIAEEFKDILTEVRIVGLQMKEE